MARAGQFLTGNVKGSEPGKGCRKTALLRFKNNNNNSNNNNRDSDVQMVKCRN